MTAFIIVACVTLIALVNLDLTVVLLALVLGIYNDSVKCAAKSVATWYHPAWVNALARGNTKYDREFIKIARGMFVSYLKHKVRK